jgi:tellurite resistance protein TerC
VFSILVLVLLAVDFVVLRAKGSHRVPMREAALWSLVWVSAAAAFCAWFWWHLTGLYGREVADDKALEFITGYLIEKSLAVDNVFVWLSLFAYFAVPIEFQKRVLLYGVLGAIVMRAVLIFLGAILLAKFHWVLYLFGAFLVLSGAKLLWMAGKEEQSIESNPMLRWLQGHIRMVHEYHGERFFIVQRGVRYATPLFVVLLFVELTDLIFAVDSIPAIFAVTSDPFIVFTSNIFAILGLRAMYFMLQGLADKFHYLKYGLAFILLFIGGKMLLLDVYKIPIGIALGVVAVILVLAVAASWIWPKKKPGGSATGHGSE